MPEIKKIEIELPQYYYYHLINPLLERGFKIIDDNKLIKEIIETYIFKKIENIKEFIKKDFFFKIGDLIEKGILKNLKT